MPIFDILGKKWSLEILKLLSKSSKSFSEIEKVVKYPKPTSDRLRDLEQLGIVKRKVQQDKQRSVLYGLTELGKKLIIEIQDIEELFEQ